MYRVGHWLLDITPPKATGASPLAAYTYAYSQDSDTARPRYISL